ncbi:MAG: tetratricopeptide repeat protein [Bacteroidota bacterium]
MIKQIIILCYLSLVITVSVFSQNTQAEEATNRIYRDAFELFEKEQFRAAQDKFREYLAVAEDPTEEFYIQSSFYAGICALKLEQSDFEVNIREFIDDYPSHPKARRAYYYLGSYYFDQGKYEEALKNFAYTSLESIQDDSDLEAAFKLGYTYFALERYDRAKSYLAIVSESIHKYAPAASYYAGYIAYNDGNDDEALGFLERSKGNINYRDKSLELIAAVYYRQQRYNEVLELANGVRQAPSGLTLLAGECYFIRTDFQNAGKYFDAYLEEVPDPTDRGTNYRIGYTMLQSSRAADAIPFLSTAANGEDTLGQAGAFHLGLAYIVSNNKEPALLAFDKSRKMSFDPIVQEQAAYYYVKVAYDIGRFTEAIEGGEDYLSAFANGEHSQEVYSLASEAFLNTGNYEKAIDYLNKVQGKNLRLQEAYQEIAFNKAVQDFNDANYRTAVASLSNALAYQVNPTITNAANFWLGETYAIGGKYDSAIVHYSRVSPADPMYLQTTYGIGYAYYNSKDYSSASRYFLQYIRNASASVSKDKQVDALVRLADCYYVLKSYDQALQYYDAALENNSLEPDYVYFQKGQVARFMNRLNDAVANFDAVISSYPSSPYRDKALFNRAEIYFENGRRDDASQNYTALITEYPESQVVPYALAKRALAASTNGNQQAAVVDYKKILDNHISNQSLAETAIQSLQEINAGGFPIYDLQDYVSKFSNIYAGSEVVLKAKFENAQKPFIDENYLQAVQNLTQFIQTTPTTAYTYEAYYKLGFCYEMLNEIPRAIESYNEVEGDYKVRSVRNVADLEYQRKNFSVAAEKYGELQQIARKKRYIKDALVGLTKSYFEISDLEATNYYAEQIITENLKGDFNVAELYKGKVLLAKSQPDAAIVQFKKAINLAQDKYAAEAQYNIGLALRQKEQYQESIASLIEVKNKYETYSQWVYEAFLVIAENYINLDNSFQAKATLESIVEYSNDEDVKARAAKRLAEIS